MFYISSRNKNCKSCAYLQKWRHNEIYLSWPFVYITCSIGVLERLIYHRLLKFINKYQILYLYQIGFQQKHSNLMALADFIDRATGFIDNGEYAIGIFLYFSKAFDAMNHDILFMKLHHYGVRGLSLLWFKSYMSDRLRYVSYNHYDSTLQMRTLIIFSNWSNALLFFLCWCFFCFVLLSCTFSCQDIIFAERATEPKKLIGVSAALFHTTWIVNKHIFDLTCGTVAATSLIWKLACCLQTESGTS